MKKIFDVTVSVVLVVCAVAMSSMYVYRQLRPVQSSTAPKVAVKVTEWPSILSSGRVIAGEETARVKVAVLTDFECPSCRGLHTRIHEWMAAYPADLQITYIHHPLDYHKFALPAARISECLRSTVPLQRWSDVVFSQQDSLGKKSWGKLAMEAGAPDTSAVNECANNPSPVRAIEDGLKIGERIALGGTPTVIVNGWKFSGQPSRTQMDSIVSAARSANRGE